MGRLLREPLLHFLLAGVLLFAGYRWLHPLDGEQGARRIELTADDLRQIQIAWLAQGRETLTPEQLASLVDTRVREEILYREALALGLDQDDTIVRRRLAQKMDFLFEDVAALQDPSEDELRGWYARHAERFTQPARVSFRHRYFSPDRRGDAARDDAARALAQLAGKSGDAPSAAALGDPFMFQDYYGDRAPDDVAAAFGPGFARALFALDQGVWAGPLESGYGWHLVWIDALTPAEQPAFEDVAPEVEREWLEAQRAEIRERAFAAMRKRYEVVLPEDLAPLDVAGLRAEVERATNPPQ